jgi:hypothetical protein
MMNTKKIISCLLLLFGEALIITVFILFAGHLSDDIIVLNILVSTIIYGLFFVDILVPWVDFGDKSHRSVGSMGVRWLAIWLYTVAAIAVMVVANIVFDWIFATQLIVHGGLLFFLFLGLFGAMHVSDKVIQVYEIETGNREGLIEMKKAIIRLKDKLEELPELPEELSGNFRYRINSLEENLRFVSPTENSEAHELEKSFVETVNTIGFALTNYSLNEQQIENNLKKCERIYQNRRQIYSN